MTRCTSLPASGPRGLTAPTTVGFSKEHDLVEDLGTNQNASAQETVDLQALTLLPGSNTDAVPELGPKFKRGDQVKLRRRITVQLPGSDKRKNLPGGTEASVVGLSDEHGNRVIIMILVAVEKDAYPVEITHVTGHSNLQSHRRGP